MSADVPHRVYRCYDTDDTLVYVGCTSQTVKHRLAVHRLHSPAVWERTARWTADEYPNKETAYAAEAQAIYDEAPLLNVRHNAKRVVGAGRYVTVSDEELRAAINLLSAETA